MSTPTLRRPSPRRLLALGAGLGVAGAGLVFPFSSSASAAGFNVSYSLTNNTNQVLTLKKARAGNGKPCAVDLNQAVVECPSTTPQDIPASVSNPVVSTGQTTVVTLTFEPRNPPESFEAYYAIGDHAFVSLSENRNGYGCKVIGTKDYVCRLSGQGLERVWTLSPA